MLPVLVRLGLFKYMRFVNKIGKMGWHHVALRAMLAACVGLSLWVAYLSFSIPTNYSTDGWDLAWVGFDAGMLAVLVAATVSIWRKRASAIIYLGALSFYLLADCWFDVATSRGRDFISALLLAVLLEIPLAIFLFLLSRGMLHRVTGGAHLGDKRLDLFSMGGK